MRTPAADVFADVQVEYTPGLPPRHLGGFVESFGLGAAAPAAGLAGGATTAFVRADQPAAVGASLAWAGAASRNSRNGPHRVGALERRRHAAAGARHASSLVISAIRALRCR